MKLRELIDEIQKHFQIKTIENTISNEYFTLYPPHLKLFKEQLQSCDEFKYVDLEILNLPNIVNETGDLQISSGSLLITDNIKLSGRIYIYSIWLTPEMYSPNEIIQVVKDNAGITPTMFDEEDFTPHKYIIMKFSPEELQNVKASNVDSPDRLKSLLEKVLNNPAEYQVKGRRDVVIRGIFESIESDGKVTRKNIEFLKQIL